MTVTEAERERLNMVALKIGATFGAVGVVLMVLIGNFAPVGPEIQFTSFLVGAGLVIIGLIFIVKGGEFGQAYVEKQRAASFQEDESGIVWVWVVAIATWGIMAIAYFALSGVVYMILDQVEEMGAGWGDLYLANITLTRDVCGWFLIIMTVGIVGWALINSARREDQTFPV